MSYLTLKKYGYINRKDVLNEYQRRYECYDSKHIDFDIGSFPAFFVETKEIRNTVLQLHKKDKKVIKLCERLPKRALIQYMVRCMMDEIQITNSIEGVHSTKKEIHDALEKRGKRFIGIVNKYRLLMEKKVIHLNTCQDLRDLYDDLVLKEVLEESNQDFPDGKIFRKGQVFISGEKIEPIHEGLFPEEAIIDSMEAALNYLNDDSEEILYRISVFHYLLGYIHPFYNGNGRLNRFISSYMLTKEFDPLIAYSLSYMVKNEQTKYNRAFTECNDKDNRGELTPFVELFLDILSESMDNLIFELNTRCDAWKRYSDNISRLPFGTKKNYSLIYELLIIHELFAPYGAAIHDIEKETKLSKPTIRNILNVIEEAGLIKKECISKKYLYSIRLDKMDEIIPE